ncbi:hypothetical protein Natoc_3106 [Natronococcus occultus SP4]|uniref:Uncharacterized protein n=1 Tax=Natronococcus occultus SP4 TaxID=694430 RepID=L0K3D3_9EURY|nr:hypothetical protein Natoc_3106 [Natronococcus occultus SP4]
MKKQRAITDAERERDETGVLARIREFVARE